MKEIRETLLAILAGFALCGVAQLFFPISDLISLSSNRGGHGISVILDN